MTSGKWQPESSLIDRYKSESNIYQLSYCDDSDDAEDCQRPEDQKVLAELKRTESFMELSPQKPSRSPLDAIRQLVIDIGDAAALDAVPQLVRVLQEEFAPNGGEDNDVAASIPYPPVDAFTLDLLDYRLGRKPDALVSVPPAPACKYETLAAHDPFDMDFDFEVVCKNGLPEIPFNPTGNERSPLHKSGGFGPFLDSLLNRLGSMHKNCFYTNLLLTDIVLILASFHQHPLAEVLLGLVDIQWKVPVRTLYQVLLDVRKDLEFALAAIPNWRVLVEQATRFLHGPSDRNPEKVLPPPVLVQTDLGVERGSAKVSQQERARSASVSPPVPTPPPPAAPPPPRLSQQPRGRPHDPAAFTRPPPACNRSASVTPVNVPRWRTKVLEPMVPTTPPALPSARQRRSSIDRLSQLFGLSNSSPTPTCPPPTLVIPVCTRNIIFAYVVFNDFCLELASLCCEHGVAFASVLPGFEKTLDLEH
ncbi:unnamed protein product [Mesocestoides corti]|uniref:FHF complex subunit HOOK-interacting protein C-terminal domain-containing protein n=1 Tax=Mesocestoides corti TaxID=53468 RepID=A0A0R3UHS0_MESCO|nr:unnamed protein product [Mesocestoides corti]